MLKTKILAVAILSGLAFQASALGNLADVQIFDRSAQRELPVYMYRGQAYVVGTPGNEYQVQIRNQAGVNIMAVTSVDGVNVITGKNASFAQGGYLVTPWSEIAITGWRKSMDDTASFYFTSLGNSYAGRTGRPNNVGVIGVALFRQKPMPLSPPNIIYQEKNHNKRGVAGNNNPENSSNQSPEKMDERSNSAPAAPKSHFESSLEPSSPSPSPLGTGHGRLEESNARLVEFERESNRPNEVISILYDSYDNLISRGIIPVYRHAPKLNMPNAFPDGFVPDPN